uniref:ORF4 n=1 Tax=Cactus virus X TaxID=112227 RepID=A0A1L3KJX9_9VIRU|nr:ORF4 [Cactus virus X]
MPLPSLPLSGSSAVTLPKSYGITVSRRTCRPQHGKLGLTNLSRGSLPSTSLMVCLMRRHSTPLTDLCAYQTKRRDWLTRPTAMCTSSRATRRKVGHLPPLLWSPRAFRGRSHLEFNSCQVLNKLTFQRL